MVGLRRADTAFYLMFCGMGAESVGHASPACFGATCCICILCCPRILLWYYYRGRLQEESSSGFSFHAQA